MSSGCSASSPELTSRRHFRDSEGCHGRAFPANRVTAMRRAHYGSVCFLRPPRCFGLFLVPKMILSGMRNDPKGGSMRRHVVLASMLAAMLVCASPALADTVTVGDVVAGPISDFVTVAGFSPIEEGPTGNAPLGTDVAVAGNPV